MIRYIVKRILWLIPVILAVSFIVFGLMELAPGNFIDALQSDDMTPEVRAELIRRHNLDRPMIYRYGLYMFRLVQGDLGVSDVTGISVWNTFLTRLPNTLILSFTSIFIATVIAIPLGILAARRARTIVDNAVTVFSLIGTSMPVFWLGLLLILAFSLHLRWLPSGTFDEGIRSLILPAVASSMILLATATRQTRSNMLEVLQSDYLRTARAKGVPEGAVIRKHALGNAWIPIVTSIGINLGHQISGSVVVESVFAWPGIGRMAAEAVRARDVTTVTGTVIMTTILFVIVLLVVDLIYAGIDPRIKAQYISKNKKRKKAAPVVALRRAPVDASAAGIESPDKARPADIEKQDPEVIEPEAADAESVKAENIAEAAAGGEATLTAPVKDVPAKSFVTRGSADFEAAAKDGVLPSSGGHDDSFYIKRKVRKRSQFSGIVHSLKRNKGATAGFIILAIMFLLFIISLFISWESINSMNAGNRFSSPSLRNPFGTDNFGRDMFLRTIYGTRYTLAIGLGVVAFGAVFGVSLGCVAGFYGGKIDDTIMRFTDIVQSLPSLLLGMVIVVVLGQSLQNLILAVGIQSAPIYLRMTRASVLTVRSNEFVEAAKATGLSNFRIIFTQVLPNGWAPIIVTLSASLGLSIISASSLSYLGFGVPVPTPEWGALISTSSEFARNAPYLMFFPGVFIMLTVLAFNLLGDGLRDALDPKMRRSWQ